MPSSSRKAYTPRCLSYRTMHPSDWPDDFDDQFADAFTAFQKTLTLESTDSEKNFPSNICDSIWFFHYENQWALLGTLDTEEFFYFLASLENESWSIQFHIHSTLQPIICHAMTEPWYHCYYRDTYAPCSKCEGDLGTMDTLCADCYWDEDAERKYRRRAFYYKNPDLFTAWQAHCRHTFYPNEEIVVSPQLLQHIPKDIQPGTSAYTDYIQRFKGAIVEGMNAVMELLQEIHPGYNPNRV